LNAIDAIKNSEDTRVAEVRKLDSIKPTLRGAIMNFQSELLYGIRLIIETGELPEPIDLREGKNVQNKRES